MNITQFIKENKDLKELPFLVVFRTIQVLREQGFIEDLDTEEDVD